MVPCDGDNSFLVPSIFGIQTDSRKEGSRRSFLKVGTDPGLSLLCNGSLVRAWNFQVLLHFVSQRQKMLVRD